LVIFRNILGDPGLLPGLVLGAPGIMGLIIPEGGGTSMPFSTRRPLAWIRLLTMRASFSFGVRGSSVGIMDGAMGWVIGGGV